MKAKISFIRWNIITILVLMAGALNAQSLHFDAPIDSNLTYFEDDFLPIPYSTGTVNITNSSSVAVYSSKSITLNSGFTADSHDGSTSFFAMTHFGPCNTNRVCQYIDNSNFDFLSAPGIPPQSLTPPTGSPVLRACPWTSVRGTADYFHRLGGFQNRIPNNVFGSASDHSGTGNAYTGVISYAFTLPNTPPIYSEFLSQPLNSVLIPQQYYAEFYFQHSSKSKYAVDQIGMYLSQWPVVPMTTTTPVIQSSGTLLDGIGWERISGCFTPSSNLYWVMFGTSVVNPTLVNNTPGNVDEAYYYIDDPAIVPFKVDAGLDISVCSNESVEIGKANCLSSLNSPGITYHWIKLTGALGSGLDNPDIYNPNFLLNNPYFYPITQIYKVTATTETGCTTSDYVQVTIYPKFNATIEALPSNCNGSCSGSAEVSVNGASATYSYLWSPNSETTPQITGLCAGTYSVLITDANNCSVSEDVEILPNNDLIADAGSGAQICSGATYILGGSPTGSGGSSNTSYNYNWSPSTGLNYFDVANPIVTVSSTTITYSVTITDNLGCTAQDNVTIIPTGGAAPVADIGVPSGTLTITGCGLGYADVGTPAVVGVTYQWTCSSPVGFTAILDPTSAQTQLQYVFSPTDPTSTYYYYLTATQNSCVSMDYVRTTFGWCRKRAPIEENNENISCIAVINPNPASTVINLNLSENESERIHVEIFNILGRKEIIVEFENASSGNQINIASLKPGLYFCKYRTENSCEGIGKFIVQ